MHLGSAHDFELLPEIGFRLMLSGSAQCLPHPLGDRHLMATCDTLDIAHFHVFEDHLQTVRLSSGRSQILDSPA